MDKNCILMKCLSLKSRRETVVVWHAKVDSLSGHKDKWSTLRLLGDWNPQRLIVHQQSIMQKTFYAY
jgi:hypothetical protein